MNAGPDFAVIIPAAGRSMRFGGDKLAQIVCGHSVLEQSLRAFLDRGDVARVVVAVADPAVPLPVAPAVANHAKLNVCGGGAHRALSVRLALEALASLPGAPEFVAIHDAARPAISQALIDRVFAAARAHGAAVPALPVGDTIKRVREGVVIETPRRSGLLAVQTPQAMRRSWLEEAFAKCSGPLEQITDDAQLLELAGRRVHIVEGDLENLKITQAADLERVERILSRRHAGTG